MNEKYIELIVDGDSIGIFKLSATDTWGKAIERYLKVGGELVVRKATDEKEIQDATKLVG